MIIINFKEIRIGLLDTAIFLHLSKKTFSKSEKWVRNQCNVYIYYFAEHDFSNKNIKVRK